MREIVSKVRQVSDLIAGISNATAEQSSGIGQLHLALSRLEQVTQQNAGLVEQTAAGAEAMKAQAARLAEAVGVFER